MPRNVVTETFEGTVSLELGEEVKGQKILLTNLLDGTVYQLGETMLAEEGNLINVPCMDSPFMLTFGDFFDWEETK